MIINGEYKMSRTILKAWYNLDSLLLAYEGVDWQNQSNWECNHMIPPARHQQYGDGISIHPLEVVFHVFFFYLN